MAERRWIGRSGVGWLVFVPAVVGCAKERTVAPESMEEVVGFLFANWEDGPSVEAGFANLAGFVRDEVDSEDAAKGWQLTTLTQEQADSVTHEDMPLTDLIGAAAAARSPFTVDEHVATFGLEDQLWGNPVSWDTYTRDILAGTANQFENHVGLLRTANDVQTELIGIHIPYILFKDFRWVEGDGGDDVVARSWIAELSCNDGGGNCVELSFSLDVWQGEGDETLRFTASWTDIKSTIDPGEDFLIASLAGGIQNVFRFTDEFLADTAP